MADIHVVSSARRAVAFDPTIPAVLEIPSGATVRFDTDDAAFVRLAAGESLESIGIENVNTVTGPVAIRGAEPGDALRIEVLDIHIARAWSVWIPGFGPLGSRTTVVRAMQTPIDGASIRITDTLSVPLSPMIGCIGLAPVAGRGSTMRPTYPFGGNMDLRELSPGATLWLPIQVPGGLLSLGDLHAAMGHGEPAHVSLEAAGSATVRISVEKARPLRYPRLRVDRDTICIGMDDAPRAMGGIAAAYQRAVDQAFELLTDERGLEPFAAYTYISARVTTRFGGPAGSLVLAVVPDLDRPEA
jgi:amidase